MPKVLTKKKDHLEPQHPIQLFECCICLDKKETINQPCGLNSHRICKPCITSIIKKIPISEANPNIPCQYPFGDCDKVYGKTFIKTILKDAYPLYKLARNSYLYSNYVTDYCPGCDSLLVFEPEIDYEMVYECAFCEKWYCFKCKTESLDECISCAKCTGYDNINPHGQNFFFYKEEKRENITDFFYVNSQIDPKTACNQLVQKLTEVAVRCPVCITPIQRSEQCNSLRHCHVEICSNCGTFSKIGGELSDHWSARGHGCARWESDPIYNDMIPNFICKEGECYSHEKGDCNTLLHEDGKNEQAIFKKKQYMYHSLKSLLPRLRYEIINLLPDEFKDLVPTNELFDRIDCNSEHLTTRFYMKQ